MNRPLCTKCNKNLARPRKNGYGPTCDGCARNPDKLRQRNVERRKRLRPWVFYRKEFCERCGFVPEHPCQLAVDHIDGDKKNNDPSNLKTLCHNCHSLKTYMADEHSRPGSRRPVQVLAAMMPPTVVTS